MISSRLIAHIVAKSFVVRMGELSSRRREPHLVRARRLTWLLARELTAESYPKIAKAFGYDHSTVVYGVQVGRDQLKIDASFADQYQHLKDRVLVAATLDPENTIELDALDALRREHVALLAAAKRVVASSLTYATALSGPRERAAHTDLMKALKGLQTHFNKDLNA